MNPFEASPRVSKRLITTAKTRRTVFFFLLRSVVVDYFFTLRITIKPSPGQISSHFYIIFRTPASSAATLPPPHGSQHIRRLVSRALSRRAAAHAVVTCTAITVSSRFGCSARTCVVSQPAAEDSIKTCTRAYFRRQRVFFI